VCQRRPDCASCAIEARTRLTSSKCGPHAETLSAQFAQAVRLIELRCRASSWASSPDVT